jgi:hypothetical protein
MIFHLRISTSLDLQDYEINHFAESAAMRQPLTHMYIPGFHPRFARRTTGKHHKKIASFLWKRKAKKGAGREAE